MIEYIIKSFTNFSSNWEKVTSTIMESQFFTDNITSMEITPWIMFSLIILVAILMIPTSESDEFFLDILSLILGFIIIMILIILSNGSIAFNYLEKDVSDWAPKCFLPSKEDKTGLDFYLSTRFDLPALGSSSNWMVEAPTGCPLPTLVGESPVWFSDESARQTYEEVNRSFIELKRLILVKYNYKLSGVVEYTWEERNDDTNSLWGKVIQIEALEQWCRIILNNPQGPGDRLAFHYCYDYIKVHNRVLREIPRTFRSVIQECHGQFVRITPPDMVFDAINDLPRF